MKHVNLEEPYYDENGREIKEFAVLKVFHYIGARRKKEYMYKWVRVIEHQGKSYFYAQHLTDDEAFFEKGSDKKFTGYRLAGVANPSRKIIGTVVVQCYDEYRVKEDEK